MDCRVVVIDVVEHLENADILSLSLSLSPNPVPAPIENFLLILWSPYSNSTHLSPLTSGERRPFRSA